MRIINLLVILVLLVGVLYAMFPQNSTTANSTDPLSPLNDPYHCVRTGECHPLD